MERLNVLVAGAASGRFQLVFVREFLPREVGVAVDAVDGGVNGILEFGRVDVDGDLLPVARAGQTVILVAVEALAVLLPPSASPSEEDRRDERRDDEVWSHGSTPIIGRMEPGRPWSGRGSPHEALALRGANRPAFEGLGGQGDVDDAAAALREDAGPAAHGIDEHDGDKE